MSDGVATYARLERVKNGSLPHTIEAIKYRQPFRQRNKAGANRTVVTYKQCFYF